MLDDKNKLNYIKVTQKTEVISNNNKIPTNNTEIPTNNTEIPTDNTENIITPTDNTVEKDKTKTFYNPAKEVFERN
jgi:hypothetical protein